MLHQRAARSTEKALIALDATTGLLLRQLERLPSLDAGRPPKR
jgi:hypothetical protein